MKKIKKNWYLFLIMLFFAGVIILYSVCGTNSYIQVQDNLDLFTAQYQMMKNTGTFFAHGAQAPFMVEFQETHYRQNCRLRAYCI